MSLKSRILRFLAILLLVFLFAGYFAFSTFLFSPIESGLAVDVAALVPRRVDFFVAKANLDASFEGFPRVAVHDDLDRNPAWRTWITSPEYGDLDRDMKVEETLAQLARATAALPLGLEPQDVFGREDLALAGFFRGNQIEQADWAVYGRVNWLGKLAVELLAYPGLIGLEQQGITAGQEDDYVVLSGGQLTRDLYVSRMRDVVIISTTSELVTEAFALAQKSFEDSVLQSAPYHDHIAKAKRTADRDEIEISIKTRVLFENLQISGAWPDAKSQDFTPAFLGKFFQLGSIKNVFGVIGADNDNDVRIELHGEFSSELITPLQARLYRQRGFDRDAVLDDIARLAPDDSFLFVYLHGHVGDLLTQVIASMEPAIRQLLEEAFQNTGKYKDLAQVIAELDGSMRNRLALIVRPNDYPPDPEGPPHDDTPVPAAALIAWTSDVEPVTRLRDLIGRSGGQFGLQGKNPGDPGYFRNIVEGGFEVREFWAFAVPGTGVISTVNADDVMVVANSFRMLGHILKTYHQGGRENPRLADDSRFRALMNDSLNQANVLVWLDPQSAQGFLRETGRYNASGSISIDWATERARVEDQVLRESFPGKQRGKLTPEIQTQVDAIVDPRLESIRERIEAEQVPALMAEQERMLSYAGAVGGVLALLALDPKSFDLSARIITTVGDD